METVYNAKVAQEGTAAAWGDIAGTAAPYVASLFVAPEDIAAAGARGADLLGQAGEFLRPLSKISYSSSLDILGSGPQFQFGRIGEYANEVAPLSGSVPNAGALGTAIQMYYPPSGGFLLTPTPETLNTGYQFSRFGGFFDETGAFTDFGNFVAPVDVPYEMRSLPPGADVTRPLTTYEVLKPMPDVLSGPAAPAFDQLGLGMQHQLPMTIQDYLDQGYIRIVNQVVPKNP